MTSRLTIIESTCLRKSSYLCNGLLKRAQSVFFYPEARWRYSMRHTIRRWWEPTWMAKECLLRCGAVQYGQRICCCKRFHLEFPRRRRWPTRSSRAFVRILTFLSTCSQEVHYHRDRGRHDLHTSTGVGSVHGDRSWSPNVAICTLLLPTNGWCCIPVFSLDGGHSSASPWTLIFCLIFIIYVKMWGMSMRNAVQSVTETIG